MSVKVHAFVAIISLEGQLVMRQSVCAIVLLLGGLACAAQSKHYLLEETTVQADKKQQFEISQKDYCAAVVRGGGPSCLVFGPTTLSMPNRYWILLSFTSFGHYDEGTYTSKGMSPEQANDLNSRRSPTIGSVKESVIESMGPIQPEQPTFAPIILITEIHVAPGKVHAFLKLLSKIGLPAVQMTPAGALEAYQTVADGDPDRLFIIQNLHKFAELDATISFRSEAPARKTVILNDAFAKYVRSSYVTVMRYRQELSAISK